MAAGMSVAFKRQKKNAVRKFFTGDHQNTFALEYLFVA